MQPFADPSFHNETEYRYFKVFQDQTAAELSGYFDSNVWNRSILQLCHEEVFARQAVIAIGALHTTMEVVQSRPEASIHSKPRRELGLPHHEFALQQYGKALQSMRELSKRKTASWFRNTLLSCLLTTCFENYIGSHDNALAQAQAGIEILTESELRSECRAPDDLTFVMGTYSFDDADLLGTFARLEASLILFRGTHQAPRRLLPLRKEESAVFKNIPATFESVREARFCWDLSVRRALQWREAYVQRLHFSVLDFGESNIAYNLQKADAFAERVQTEIGLYVQAKAQWFRAFRPLFERSRSSPGSKEFLSASVLMIQYLSANVSIRSPGGNLEEYCDAFLEDFITIVDLARECLETSTGTASPGRAVFAFDDGLVAGIFLVATRCRDSVVRRNAIGLLRRYPRREGQ